MEKEIEKFLDERLFNFFPKEGVWYSTCFSRTKELEFNNLPCHLRDNNWLADFIKQEYELYAFKKEIILDYITKSEKFNKLRHEYEQRIVNWQIEWMCNGGEGWIVDEELGGDFYILGTECDYAFRKGIVDTLSRIGMDIDAIEEGIEKNANKWREGHMRLAFYNMYSVSYFLFCGKPEDMLKEPSQEHYEKWMKLRLYEYYVEHKDSVDKYGEVLPEMKMTEQEVEELKIWLDEAHEKRIKQVSEFENKMYSFRGDELVYRGESMPQIKIKDDNITAKTNEKTPRLDFNTWLYLYITRVKKVNHILVDDNKKNLNIGNKKIDIHEAYVFRNYDEYKKFFLMHLDDISDEIIDLAIYTRGKKGQIVALKGLCEHTIIKKKVNDFYNSITSEQIKEIHSKGKLTPLEAVQLWESYDLCMPSSNNLMNKYRCEFFDYNCHECLMEYASHNLEYDNFETENIHVKKLKK